MTTRPASPQAARQVRLNTPLRQARTCHGHLAGVAGVRLFDELRRRGLFEVAGTAPRPDITLTKKGRDALDLLGVHASAAPGSRRRFAYACTDWTERRYHLGGALGEAVMRRLVEMGLAHRVEGTRVVELHDSFSTYLTVTPPRP